MSDRMTIYAALALLLAPARGQTMGAPPPPAPGACMYSPQVDVTYDLTSLMAWPADIEVQDSSGTGAKFFIAVCKEPQKKCSPSTCQTCDVNNPAGTNTFPGGAGQDSCGAIGKFDTVQFGLQSPADPNGGVMMTMSGGDPGSDGRRRSATVNINCGSGSPVGVSGVETPPGSLQYVITIEAAAACPVCLEGCPLSWGWLSIIFGGVAVAVYFGGGLAYNIRVKGEEGVAAVPHWDYWILLPGLVKDGCAFFYAESRLWMRDGRKRFREYLDNRGSKELREPIAAVPEGS